MALAPLKNPKNIISILKGNTLGFIGGSSLFLVLVVVNVFQSLSIVFRPLLPGLCRRFNRNLGQFWWSLCVLWARKVNRVQIVVTGDAVPLKENSLVILNHQSMTDVPIVLDYAYQKKRLGDIKCFVKDSLKYFPGMGWGMMMLDFPFVKRNWNQDKTHIQNTFQKFLTHQIPVWMLSFSEGTRLRPKKLKRSQEYAKKTGILPTENVMLPRTKGFLATINHLGEHCPVIYDLTIGYVDGVPSVWQWCCGYVSQVHLHARRFLVKDLPLKDEERSDWLLNLFYEKDSLLSDFYQSGQFSDLKADSQKTARVS